MGDTALAIAAVLAVAVLVLVERGHPRGYRTRAPKLVRARTRS